MEYAATCFDDRRPASRSSSPLRSHSAPVATDVRSGPAAGFRGAIGNQALQRLIGRPVDAWLLRGVGVPLRRDPLEREADSVADRFAGVEGASTTETAPPDSGSGRPLPRALRSGLERTLPYDLAPVRLHTDAGAHAAARRLGARAVTIGRDIAFAPGAYDPHSRTGRRLIAHEVAHTAQQGAVGRRGGAGPVLTRSPAGMPQRTPGVDAPDSWNEVVVSFTVTPRDPGVQRRAEDSKRRFLAIVEGARLINSLWRLAHPRGSARPRFRVSVSFVDQIPAALGGGGSEPPGIAGRFEPDDPLASGYSVWVLNVQPPMRGVISLGGTTASGAFYHHTDPESDMASTLQHELLHIEFVRAGLGSIWPTGHGPSPATQTEPLFLQREQAAHADLDALETRIRQEAQARNEAEQRRRDAEARRQAEEEDRRRPPAARPADTGPRAVGGAVRAEGGATWGFGPTRGTAIVGADLILRRIADLRLGARGVYLSPDHRLLAGGTIGRRFTQGGDSVPGETVENPLFFDIELGVLAELNPGEASRITNRVAGLGSAGVGQEYGSSGTRFFWRVGGYVIISDRPGPRSSVTVGGGVAGGVGLSF